MTSVTSARHKRFALKVTTWGTLKLTRDQEIALIACTFDLVNLQAWIHAIPLVTSKWTCVNTTL